METFTIDKYTVRDAKESELNYIHDLEADPQASPFVLCETPEEHKRYFQLPGWELMTILEGEKPVGFFLAHIDRESDVFELTRFVVEQRGKGTGTVLLRGLMEHAFTKMGINRFWLDVFPGNVRGIALYEKLGMHRDGVLRQHRRFQGRYTDQIIYSMLKEEFE